jgi:glycogen(starch) synthase
MYHELRQVCASVEHDMGARLFRRVVQGRIPDPKDIFSESQALRIRRSMLAWQSKKLPRNVTHDLEEGDGDPVIQKMRSCGLLNAEKDRVKAVFHPRFVTSTSPIMGLDYQQFVRGCNLGVFPSYYEPWGYTPMECVALGIPAVASDLSGFGNYLASVLPDYSANGLFVINRRALKPKETVETLTDFLYDFCRLNRRQRREIRNRVERVSHVFDWSEVIRYYRDAYKKALKE